MARWYIIHAYSGFENKVRDQILAEAERIGLSQLVEAVEVPTEQVTEVRRGKKIKAERKFFPGYVLAKLNMNDDVYHLVKNTAKVTGFLGAGNKPQPISEAEAARILNTKQEMEAAPKKRVSVDYEIGDQVKVLGGRCGRRTRFRQEPREGIRQHLWPRDTGRTGFRRSRIDEVMAFAGYLSFL